MASNPRTVAMTVDSVAENAESPTITAAITAPTGPTASRAMAENTSSMFSA